MEYKFCSTWVRLHKINYSDYLKSLISRINEVYISEIKHRNFILAVYFAASTLVIVSTWFM